jgi:hypothetical protein
MCHLSAIGTVDKPHPHGAFVPSIITNSSRDIILHLRDLAGYPFTYYTCTVTAKCICTITILVCATTFVHDQDRGQESLGI